MKWLFGVSIIFFVSLLVLPGARAQDVTSTLGNDTTATFEVVDSSANEILVLEAKDQASEGPNIIGGHNDNAVTSGAYAATISGGGVSSYANQVTDDFGSVGGGYDNTAGNNAGTTSDAQSATISGGRGNTASDNGATIGGGIYNTASGADSTIAGGYAQVAGSGYTTIAGGYGNTAAGVYATTSGGVYNLASALSSTVAGGNSNTARGNYAAIAGGYWNMAGGLYSFAAGRNANADQDNCFIWNDSSTQRSCTATNQVIFYYGGSGNNCHIEGSASGWTCTSDENRKENFLLVDGVETLERLSSMPVLEYNMKGADPSVRRVGPVSQDFYAAFELGDDDRGINAMDAIGVTMASVQGLHEMVRTQQEEIAALRSRLCELEETNKALTTQNALFEIEYERISALESRIGRLEESAVGSALK